MLIHTAFLYVKIDSITNPFVFQPRLSVFQCFTHLCLLAPGGRLVFSNETRGITPYLEGVGFVLPPGENAADWMLDCVMGSQPLYDPHVWIMGNGFFLIGENFIPGRY